MNPQLATTAEVVPDMVMQQLFVASTPNILWHQGATAEPLWFPESDTNLIYKLYAFVISQHVK